MKYLLRRIVPGLLLLSLMSAPAWAQTRIATVDLRKVFDSYWKTKQADSALKDRAADMEKEHKNMLDDYKKSRENYSKLLADASDQAVSSDEREKRKKVAEDKLKEIKDSEEAITQYERQARTTLDEQRKRMRDNILSEIRGVLNSKAKAGSYTMVIDTAAESANNTPIVLFTADIKENDLTDAVLSQLNATAPPDFGKPDEKLEQKTDKASDTKK